MTEAELIAIVTREIRGLSTNFDGDDYADAVDSAERETGFTLPVTSDFQIFWLGNRTKRALYVSLLAENAEQFGVKQINLQHKFANFYKLIEKMDADFEKAKEENPSEFANVSTYQLFGTKIDAGFAYDDDTGEDRTYDDDQYVISTPNESS